MMVIESIYDKDYRKAKNMPPISAPIQCANADKGREEWKAYARDNLWWAHENLISLGRAAVVTKYGGRHSANSPDMREFLQLHILLLSIGGVETVFPDIEEDMDSILNRGRFYRGTSKMMLGRSNACHANTCRLWEANHGDKDVAIATGYALSSDGFWRQHSWLVHRYMTQSGQHRTRIVETTEKRLAYFGFEMTDDESLEFCDLN